jgi:hypothetical protein
MYYRSILHKTIIDFTKTLLTATVTQVDVAVPIRSLLPAPGFVHSSAVKVTLEKKQKIQKLNNVNILPAKFSDGLTGEGLFLAAIRRHRWTQTATAAESETTSPKFTVG